MLSSAQTDLDGKLKELGEQLRLQAEAEQRADVARIRQSYLTPLRYYAHSLSERLAEFAEKLESSQAETTRGWFMPVKDHVARDKLRLDYESWCYYEGPVRAHDDLLHLLVLLLRQTRAVLSPTQRGQAEVR